MPAGFPAIALLALLAASPSSRAPVDSSAATPDSGRAGADSSIAVRDSLPFRLRAVSVVPRSPGGSGRVVEPAGVTTDAFGRIYVTDAALHRLQRYDERGGWLGEAGALGSGAGEMRRPGAVAALGTLSIAVLDEENRRVLSYDLFGHLLGTLIDLEDPTLSDQLGRVRPVDLAADRGGAVYVADSERDRLLSFDFSGRYLRTVGGYGSRPGSFRGLKGIAVGRRGELFTAERLNARIQRLDPSGRVLASWSLPVRAVPGALPVAVDDSARVAVADQASGRLWVFDAFGVPLATLEGLEDPRGLAFARDGTLLVAESGAGRVRRYVLEPAIDRSAPREE